MSACYICTSAVPYTVASRAGALTQEGRALPQFSICSTQTVHYFSVTGGLFSFLESERRALFGKTLPYNLISSIHQQVRQSFVLNESMVKESGPKICICISISAMAITYVGSNSFW